MAKYKPWDSKDWLYQKYKLERKTIDQIADECKAMNVSVTPQTIYNALKKFDLIVNGRKLGSRTIGGGGKGFYS